MLEHLKALAVAALADSDVVFLSTYGAAGLQASAVSSRAVDLTLYLTIPYSSDHLANLQGPTTAIVCTPGWEVHGVAAVVGPCPAGPGPRTAVLHPSRLTIHAPSGRGNSLTIDL